jgi:hypothetical protein
MIRFVQAFQKGQYEVVELNGAGGQHEATPA